MNLGLLILWEMEQSVAGCMVSFWQVLSPKMVHLQKKPHVFEIRGHAFLGGNQSWYVIKQNNYLWKFSCIFDVTFFFLPQIFNPRM